MGHLKKKPKGTSAYIDHVIVFVKEDTQTLAATLTDSNGYFILTLEPKKNESLDFFCTGAGIDTLLLASVANFKRDTTKMTLYVPGPYKRTILGRTLCPKCKKQDQVYTIQYGNTPIFTRQISTSGDTSYSPIYKNTYQESCIVKPANYYCNRDKVKF